MIIEGAFLALSLLSSPQPRRSCSRDFFEVGSGVSQSFTLSNGPSVEEVISMSLNEIVGVSGVRTQRNGKTLLVEVELSRFDKATRWKVYEAEDDLHQEFSDYQIEFRVIDSSWMGTLEHASIS